MSATNNLKFKQTFGGCDPQTCAAGGQTQSHTHLPPPRAGAPPIFSLE